MTIDLKKLHEICCLLCKLNNECYYKYKKLDLPTHKIDFYISYALGEEDFDDFILKGFKFDIEDGYVYILDIFEEDKTYTVESYIPLFLLDKTDVEIEEWYKKELFGLCKAKMGGETDIVDEIIVKLEKELKKLKEIKNEINTTCNN